MPSIRAPVLRIVLQPSARVLRCTQPVLTHIRQESTNPEDKRATGYRLDGSKKPEDKGTTTGYRLDGTSSFKDNRGLLFVGGITAILGVVYFIMVGKPDKIAETAIKTDPDAVKEMAGSDKQRFVRPEQLERLEQLKLRRPEQK